MWCIINSTMFITQTKTLQMVVNVLPQVLDWKDRAKVIVDLCPGFHLGLFCLISLQKPAAAATATANPSSKMATREISPMLMKFRQVLIGRPGMNPLRFPKEIAPRPGPEPTIPPGPSHKLAANYYLSRDGRRSVAPPEVLASAQKVIASGEAQVAEVAPRKKSKTPGPFFNYSESS